MGKGKTYKAIAIILFALVFVGAVTVGNFEFFRVFTEGNFNFGIFVFIIVSGLLACVPIYGIGEIIVDEKKCNCGGKEVRNAEISQNQENAEGWTCGKCMTKNERISTFCKNCGEYK